MIEEVIGLFRVIFLRSFLLVTQSLFHLFSKTMLLRFHGEVPLIHFQLFLNLWLIRLEAFLALLFPVELLDLSGLY